MLYLVIVCTTGFFLLAVHNMLNIIIISGDTGPVSESNATYVHRDRQTVQMSRHHHHQLVYDVNQ